MTVKGTQQRQGRRKHGLAGNGATKRSLYTIWVGMMARCYSESNPNYQYYGARGISVCLRWHRPEIFCQDMGNRPRNSSLDRIDNDGHYTQKNTRWASAVTQQNNKRTNNRVTVFGRTQTIAQWAREVGINEHALRYRLVHGWTPEDALTKPFAQRASLTPELRARILERYGQGVSCRVIGEEVGCSRGSVGGVLAEAGILSSGSIANRSKKATAGRALKGPGKDVDDSNPIGGMP